MSMDKTWLNYYVNKLKNLSYIFLYKNISQHLGLRDGLKKIYKVIINLYDINLLYKFFPNKIFAINVADKG